MSADREGPGAPIVALVVAMGENRAIGRGGELPWRLSTDLKQFRKITLGHPIVMGRRTFESFGRVLDQRVNIILTRDLDYRVPGAVVVHSLGDGLRRSRQEAERAGVDQIMIIGGEDVFREILPQADRIYLTEVHASPEADTWFPDLDRSQWRELSREGHPAGPKDDHAFSFVVLERVR